MYSSIFEIEEESKIEKVLFKTDWYCLVYYFAYLIKKYEYVFSLNINISVISKYLKYFVKNEISEIVSPIRFEMLKNNLIDDVIILRNLHASPKRLERVITSEKIKDELFWLSEVNVIEIESGIYTIKLYILDKDRIVTASGMEFKYKKINDIEIIFVSVYKSKDLVHTTFQFSLNDEKIRNVGITKLIDLSKFKSFSEFITFLKSKRNKKI